MHGGNTKLEAETQDKTVCVQPFSAEVTPYTLWRPNSAITLPGLWTIETPVSSELYICIGLNIRFNFP